MLDVYIGAAATIAATGALDHSEDLFFDRNPAFRLPVRLEASWSSDLVRGKYRTEIGDRLRPGIYWFCLQHIWNQSIETATHNNRAWVAQERHLSRRTFHFAKNELFWECDQLRASEQYPKGLPQWTLPHWSENPAILKQDIDKMKLLKLYERSHSVKPASFGMYTSPSSHPLETWSTCIDNRTSCAISKSRALSSLLTRSPLFVSFLVDFLDPILCRCYDKRSW